MSDPQNKTLRNNFMKAVLELISANRIGVKYPDGTYKSERHFLDFVVNGESLWDTVGKQQIFAHLLSARCADDGRFDERRSL
jgi:hypothetical protein